MAPEAEEIFTSLNEQVLARLDAVIFGPAPRSQRQMQMSRGRRPNRGRRELFVNRVNIGQSM